MVNRRDLIIAGAGLAAAGLAYELRPRHRLNLLKGEKMAAVIPTAFGDWSTHGDEGIIKPDTQGKLAASLYSEIVSRVYTQAATGAEVMMLVAYGGTQSDLLQLHRPESCYPAVGFTLDLSAPINVPLPTGAALPARQVIATKSDRQEYILYWTRIGEYLPRSAGEQRKARFQTALQGYVPDGALFRFSTLATDSQTAFRALEAFVAGMLLAVRSSERPALIGTGLARQLVR